MRDAAVGIDIGTTSVKAIVVSASGELLFERSLPHDLLSPESGYAEEDAAAWWDSCKSLLGLIAAEVETDRIAGVAFSGMVPTLVLVDERGTPIRNSIQQNDARAVREIARYRQLIDEDDYFRRTGNTINQQLIFPKYTWLETHEPHSVEQARYIMGSYDYCTYRLTGVPTLERNWALESGMWRVSDECWDEDILELVGLPRELLPPVRASGEAVGYTSAGVESDTGFPAGVPVVTGIADHVASALATGVREEGDLLLKLGGAGDVLFATGSLRFDPRLFVDYHPIAGKYLINGCMAASGSIVKWLTNVTQDTDFERLTAEAQEIEPGSGAGQIVVLPYFLGEKTPIFDTDARGVVFGLSLNHDRASLFRAVLEAVAYGFRHHVEVLHEMGHEVTDVFLSNGGARSPLWRQIVLDVIGRDGTYVPDHPGSCIGAAFVALESVLPDHNWKALEAFLARGRTIGYSSRRHRRYSHYYRLYRDLYEQLKPLFPRLNPENEE